MNKKNQKIRRLGRLVLSEMVNLGLNWPLHIGGGASFYARIFVCQHIEQISRQTERKARNYLLTSSLLHGENFLYGGTINLVRLLVMIWSHPAPIAKHKSTTVQEHLWAPFCGRKRCRNWNNQALKKSQKKSLQNTTSATMSHLSAGSLNLHSLTFNHT